MEKPDSFDVMATGISDEERKNILDQMKTSQANTGVPFHPIDENMSDSSEPLEVKLKNESFFLRFLVWLKSVLTNTTQTVIYNEHKLSEITHYIQKNFPGLISPRQSLLLSAFYERFSELKSCSDFFKPYLASLDDSDGYFYVFLSSFVIPEVSEDIKTNTDPYSNPVTPTIKPDTRSFLLRKLDDIFDTMTADNKARMYQAAKAVEWMKQFVRLPYARIIIQFSQENEREFSCPYGQIEGEIDTFARVLCNSIDIPEEFLEALYFFSIRNSKHNSDDENGRDAGDFLGKAHSSLGLLQMFMTSIPLHTLGCLIHNDSQWRITGFSGGEDWFVKFKNTWKKIFEQKWAAWEADCKKEALLSTLKTTFALDSFPRFPQCPWEDIWDTGVPFSYESTLGFLNWFMRERFSVCELDLKTLLVQGAFNKKENHAMLSESFNAMIQLSISFQELERRLSFHGEIGAMFNKIREDRSRTLQAQQKVEHMMREIESDVKSLIIKFCDNMRAINRILLGVLGLSKDTRFDTISNLNKMKDKNNEPFVKKVEESQKTIDTALNFVIELESLDTKRVKRTK